MRAKSGTLNLLVIGLALMAAILFEIATHPLAIIIIAGFGLVIFGVVKQRQKERDRKFLAVLQSLSATNFYQMTPREFEEFLGRLFEFDNYDVTVTPQSRDKGADLIVKKNGITTAIQSKLYSEKVGSKAVQEVTASLRHYDAHEGMVITNSEYTKPCEELAHVNKIKLMDGRDLENFIIEIYQKQKEKFGSEQEVEKLTKEKKYIIMGILLIISGLISVTLPIR